MPTEILIRRVVTADRGQKRVSTMDVLKCVKGMDRAFTSREVAEAMNADEYSVRRSISWLIRRGYVDKAPDNVPRQSRRAPYWGSRYVFIDRDSMCVCDVNMLNQIFLGVCA